MNTPVRLNLVTAGEVDWTSNHHEIVIGKDILELLSTSMYVDPMSIYREYIQNAADSIDEARVRGALAASGGEVQISIDPNTRTIRIRDDGASMPWPEFVERLSNLGASRKRGTQARGFRGVGRLSGLGYCQELVFRGRSDGESLISELRWDGRTLKSMMRTADNSMNLRTLVKDIVTIRRTKANGEPKRFFEVELRGVVRHRDDRLLNEEVVGQYLAQVAPLPFSPDFEFGDEIAEALKSHVRLGNIAVRVNGTKSPLHRPHQNSIEIDGKVEAAFQSLEILKLSDIDGGIAAIGWVLHHDYSGALSNRTLLKGLRMRSGNIQVGDHALVESLFPEPRFNSWAVGEIHIIDPKILPNGRRDNFEHSAHFDNVLNQLAPTARDIARRCRQSSISRKWQREFALHRDAALERARIVSRGGLTRPARQTHVDSALKSLKAMTKILENRHLDEEVRKSLSSKAEATVSRVLHLLGDKTTASDPLAALPSVKKTAYQHIISLIYECSTNRVAAGALVERLLRRLSDEAQDGRQKKAGRRSKRTTHAKSLGKR